MSALVDLEEQLLREVLRRSLDTAKTDVRRLHRKNTKALRLGIVRVRRKGEGRRRGESGPASEGSGPHRPSFHCVVV